MGNFKHFFQGELVFVDSGMWATQTYGNDGISEDDIGIVIEQSPISGFTHVYFQQLGDYRWVQPEKLNWEKLRDFPSDYIEYIKSLASKQQTNS